MDLPKLKNNLKIDKWKLRKKIGEGGQGSVWKVGHEAGKSPPAALKICLSQDEQSRARFEQECKLLMGCQHPGIIAVRDSGSFEGFPYLVMELAEFSAAQLFTGESTAASILGLAPNLVLRMFRQACEGIAYLHSLGIVHRDIKPSNILVMGASGQPVRTVVADFGIAVPQGMQGVLTKTQEFVGTRIYRAPEVEIGKSATPASDVFSLGRTLEFLFLKYDPVELSPQKCPRSASMTEAFCDKVDRIVSKACSQSPGNRYQDAGALLLDIPAMRVGVDGEWGGVFTVHGKLSAGEEKITVSGRIFGNTRRSFWSKDVSWNQIMSALGPLILWESKSESYVRDNVASRLSNYNRASVRDEIWEQIKYQLRALDLVKYKKAKSTRGDRLWFWTLTERGTALAEQAVRVLSQKQ